MAAKKNITDALDRLAAAEDQFLTGRFLAPVMRGAKVQVRIAGVRCELRVEPGDFEGWGVFRPLSHAAAQLERSMKLAERRRYLDLFPAISAVLCHQGGANWLALPAGSDSRFQIDGMFTVCLAEEADLFETVRARFDGARFWFDELDLQADAGVGAFLRENLSRMAEPKELSRPRLSSQQVGAYTIVYEERLRQQMIDQHTRVERRLAGALRHAGAQLTEFAERGDVYRVSYDVDGARHTSIVRKDDLTVQSAGICLSGEDESFDLHSLVGVLREGREQGTLHRVGLDG